MIEHDSAGRRIITKKKQNKTLILRGKSLDVQSMLAAIHCLLLLLLILLKPREWVRWLTDENRWLFLILKRFPYTSMALWQTSPKRKRPKFFWIQKSHFVFEAHLKPHSTYSLTIWRQSHCRHRVHTGLCYILEIHRDIPKI